MKTTFIAIAASICLLAALPGNASALSPPVQPQGEIVFSNAGRIISIKADGTERTVLTRKNIRVGTRNFEREFLELGDSHPAISPDGEKLAFLRTTPPGRGFLERVMVANRDGTGVKTVLRFENSYISSVDWTPANRLLLSTTMARKGPKGAYQQQLFAIGPDGGDRKVLLSGPTGSFLATPWLSAEAVSPNGRNLLYTRANLSQTELRIRNLQTGKDRRVTYGGSDAAFSPDGEQIVFVAEKCFPDEGRPCEKGKWLEPGLWTVAADGSQRRLLFGGEARAKSPSWAPDGSRIVFASPRNTPGFEDSSNEIYSITPEGKCLTWLTNGSPASHSPSFGPETDATYFPGGCGAVDRQPVVEIAPLPPRKVDARPRLWAGPQVGDRLLSSMVGYWPGTPNEIYAYADCADFRPSDCSQSLVLEASPVCGFSDEVELGRRQGTLSIRGVPVTKTGYKGRVSGTTLRSGRARLTIGESIFYDHRGAGKNTFANHLALINQLRPVGKPLVPGSKLPAPKRVSCGK